MATSFDVNINIGSSIGFNQVGAGLIIGNVPIHTTILDLDGVSYTPTIEIPAKLEIAPLSDFISVLGNTSTKQTVYLSNVGDSALTVTNIVFNIKPTIGPIFYFNTATWSVSTTTVSTTIPAHSTSTFELAYLGIETGAFDSLFIVLSNNYSGAYQVDTRQIVGNTYDFEISPSSVNTTVTKIGYTEIFTYTLTPIFNNERLPSEVVPIDHVTITGSSAWTVDSTGINTVSVRFNPNEVHNLSGTYTSTLTVYATTLDQIGFHSVTNTATIIINTATNKNLGGWLSPASHYNSIIGVSYDLEDNQRYLTIGVGMGGDGTPIYGSGGYAYASLENLGLSATHIDQPYPFWANVYRIPFTGAAQTYTSNDFIVKTTEGVDYTQYFGEYGEPGSMFIVEDDGYGSLTIELNHLSSLSEDESVNATLNNLTRAFYYYSDVDTLGRYLPLPAEYAAPIATNTGTTQLFIGFNYNTRDKTAFVNTSIVDLPV